MVILDGQFDSDSWLRPCFFLYFVSQEFACNGTVVEHPEYGTAVLLQEFACNGTVVEHPEYGEVIQLQGDQRQHISQFLKKVGLAREDQLKVCTSSSISLIILIIIETDG